MSARSNKHRKGNENARSAGNHPENDGRIKASNRPLRQSGSSGSHHGNPAQHGQGNQAQHHGNSAQHQPAALGMLPRRNQQAGRQGVLLQGAGNQGAGRQGTGNQGAGQQNTKKIEVITLSSDDEDQGTVNQLANPEIVTSTGIAYLKKQAEADRRRTESRRANQSGQPTPSLSRISTNGGNGNQLSRSTSTNASQLHGAGETADNRPSNQTIKNKRQPIEQHVRTSRFNKTTPYPETVDQALSRDRLRAREVPPPAFNARNFLAEDTVEQVLRRAEILARNAPSSQDTNQRSSQLPGAGGTANTRPANEANQAPRGIDWIPRTRVDPVPVSKSSSVMAEKTAKTPSHRNSQGQGREGSTRKPEASSSNSMMPPVASSSTSTVHRQAVVDGRRSTSKRPSIGIADQDEQNNRKKLCDKRVSPVRASPDSSTPPNLPSTSRGTSDQRQSLLQNSIQLDSVRRPNLYYRHEATAEEVAFVNRAAQYCSPRQQPQTPDGGQDAQQQEHLVAQAPTLPIGDPSNRRRSTSQQSSASPQQRNEERSETSWPSSHRLPSDWIPTESNEDLHPYLRSHWEDYCTFYESGAVIDPMPNDWILFSSSKEHRKFLSRRWRLEFFIKERQCLPDLPGIKITVPIWQAHFAIKKDKMVSKGVPSNRSTNLTGFQNEHTRISSSRSSVHEIGSSRSSVVQPRSVDRGAQPPNRMNEKQRDQPVTNHQVHTFYGIEGSSTSAPPTASELQMPRNAQMVSPSSSQPSQSDHHQNPILSVDPVNTSQERTSATLDHSSENNVMHHHHQTRHMESVRPQCQSTVADSKKRRVSGFDAPRQESDSVPITSTPASPTASEPPMPRNAQMTGPSSSQNSQFANHRNTMLLEVPANINQRIIPTNLHNLATNNIIHHHQVRQESNQQMSPAPVATFSQKQRVSGFDAPRQESDRSSTAAPPVAPESSIPPNAQRTPLSPEQPQFDRQSNPTFFEQEVASTSQGIDRHQLRREESDRRKRQSTNDMERRVSMEAHHQLPSTSSAPPPSIDPIAYLMPQYEELAVGQEIQCGDKKFLITKWTEDAPHGKFGVIAFGKCCQSESELPGDQVAIKTMRKREEEYREIEILQTLKNRYVVKMLAHTTEDDLVFLVMERMDCTLGEHINEKPHLFTLAYIQTIGRQMLGGLAYLKEKLLLHTQLNLENVMVKLKPFTIKFIDFENSVRVEKGETVRSKKFVSSLRYASPEALLDGQLSYPTDMWSFGVLCLDMFVKKPFFEGNDPDEMMYLWCMAFGYPSKALEDMNMFLERFMWNLQNERWMLKHPKKCSNDNIQTLAINGNNGSENNEEFLMFMEMLRNVLQWKPADRPNTENVLGMDFFLRILKANQSKGNGHRSI